VTIEGVWEFDSVASPLTSALLLLIIPDWVRLELHI
jgi:hypothetical protein